MLLGVKNLQQLLTWRDRLDNITHVAQFYEPDIGDELTAIALGLIGLFTNNLILMLIAFFVFGGARQEYRMEELQAVLGKVPVSQALITTSPILSPDDTLATALELTMHGHSAPYAIVENGQLAGLLTPMDITSALEIYGPGIPLGDLVRRQFPTLSPADTLAQAHHLMATSGLRALPVTEGGQFLGTVTMQQINEIYGLLTAQQRRQQSSAIK